MYKPLDITKIAKKKEKKESHKARNALMAGAAASPFMGLIGQKPIIHDPFSNTKIPRTQSMSELARQARPGDVLVTTKPTGSIWKQFMSPMTGSEFYHAQPVIGKKNRLGTTLEAGEYAPRIFKNHTLKDILNVEADTIPEAMRGNYPDVMLMRPRTPLTPEQTQRFVRESLQRGRQRYSTGQAVSGWLKDLFVPKIPGLENTKNRPVCEGAMCSSLPAMGYNSIGKSVISGKAPHSVMPTDFLRSEEFEPVIARLSREPGAMKKVTPYLARAGIGAALAGGVYGLTSNPALAGIPLGAMAASQAAQHIFKHRLPRGESLSHVLPNTGQFAKNLFELHSPEARNIVSKYLTRRAPILAAGGTLGYLAAKHLLGGKKPKDNTDR